MKLGLPGTQPLSIADYCFDNVCVCDRKIYVNVLHSPRIGTDVNVT